MTYLFLYKGANNPKNKLEAEVYDYLKAGDRLPVLEQDMDRMQAAILHQVKCLNEKYPRCTPVKVKFKQHRDGQDIHIFVGDGDTSPFHATFLKFNN